jgi:hypothetical protein
MRMEESVSGEDDDVMAKNRNKNKNKNKKTGSKNKQFTNSKRRYGVVYTD